MKCLAIDPDTHTAGIVVVSIEQTTPVLHLAKCLEIPSRYKKSGAVLEMTKALWCAMPHYVAEAGGGIDLIVVEGQQIYTSEAGHARTKNPTSILMVGQVAGAAMLAAMAFAVQPNVRFPSPAEWKGQVDKVASQARAFRAFSMPYVVVPGQTPYCYPTAPGLSGVPRGILDEVKRQHWKHVGDALALGLWGIDVEQRRIGREDRASDTELNAELGRKGHR